jgi:hypothetical protein
MHGSYIDELADLHPAFWGSSWLACTLGVCCRNNRADHADHCKPYVRRVAAGEHATACSMVEVLLEVLMLHWLF